MRTMTPTLRRLNALSLSGLMMAGTTAPTMLMTSCESLPGDRESQGAVIGGAGGAVLGAVIAKENRLIGALIGGLLGKAAGRTLGGVGRAATGMAFSFATTYALGQVAKRYYAGGRQMSTALLKQSFQDLLGPAKQMQTQYLPQIQQKAATLDAGQVMAMVRGR